MPPDDNFDEDFPGQLNDVRRQDVVEKALDSIHHIINEGTNGTTEETDYLYAEVARKLVESVNIALYGKLVRRDLESRMAKE